MVLMVKRMVHNGFIMVSFVLNPLEFLSCFYHFFFLDWPTKNITPVALYLQLEEDFWTTHEFD